MKRLCFLLIFALTQLACKLVSSIDVQATVATAIVQTQVAAASSTTQAIASQSVITTKIPTVPPPTALPTAEPVVLGGKEQVLLEIAKCSPKERGCDYQLVGIYLSDLQGAAPKKLADGASLLSLAPDGKFALVAQDDPETKQPVLFTLDIQDGSLTKITDSFQNRYRCNASRCGAVWLADANQVAYLGITKDLSGNMEVGIFLSKIDGSDTKQVGITAAGALPLFLYPSYDVNRLYWEKDAAGVLGGLAAVNIDGSNFKSYDDILAPVYSPSGTLVAYQKRINQLGYQTALFKSKPDWSDAVQIYLPQTNEYVDNVSWSPDGKRLVFDVNKCDPLCTARHYLWQTSAAELVELPSSIGYATKPGVWSPNNRYVLYISQDAQSGKHAVWAVNDETKSAQNILQGFQFSEEGAYIETIFALP
jgi:Tol biopolymer transport system component